MLKMVTLYTSNTSYTSYRGCLPKRPLVNQGKGLDKRGQLQICHLLMFYVVQDFNAGFDTIKKEKLKSQLSHSPSYSELTGQVSTHISWGQNKPLRIADPTHSIVGVRIGAKSTVVVMSSYVRYNAHKRCGQQPVDRTALPCSTLKSSTTRDCARRSGNKTKKKGKGRWAAN